MGILANIGLFCIAIYVAHVIVEFLKILLGMEDCDPGLLVIGIVAGVVYWVFRIIYWIIN